MNYHEASEQCKVHQNNLILQFDQHSQLHCDTMRSIIESTVGSHPTQKYFADLYRKIINDSTGINFLSRRQLIGPASILLRSLREAAIRFLYIYTCQEPIDDYVIRSEKALIHTKAPRLKNQLERIITAANNNPNIEHASGPLLNLNKLRSELQGDIIQHLDKSEKLPKNAYPDSFISHLEHIALADITDAVVLSWLPLLLSDTATYWAECEAIHSGVGMLGMYCGNQDYYERTNLVGIEMMNISKFISSMNYYLMTHYCINKIFQLPQLMEHYRNVFELFEDTLSLCRQSSQSIATNWK